MARQRRACRRRPIRLWRGLDELIFFRHHHFWQSLVVACAALPTLVEKTAQKFVPQRCAIFSCASVTHSCGSTAGYGLDDPRKAGLPRVFRDILVLILRSTSKVVLLTAARAYHSLPKHKRQFVHTTSNTNSCPYTRYIGREWYTMYPGVVYSVDG